MILPVDLSFQEPLCCSGQLNEMAPGYGQSMAQQPQYQEERKVADKCRQDSTNQQQDDSDRNNFAPCHKICEFSVNWRENNATQRGDRRQQLDNTRSNIRKRRLNRREYRIEDALWDREQGQRQNTHLEYITMNHLGH